MVIKKISVVLLSWFVNVNSFASNIESKTDLCLIFNEITVRIVNKEKSVWGFDQSTASGKFVRILMYLLPLFKKKKDMTGK